MGASWSETTGRDFGKCESGASCRVREEPALDVAMPVSFVQVQVQMNKKCVRFS